MESVDSDRFSVRDHRNLLKSRGGEMEMAKSGLDEQTRMKVVLEVGEVGEEELMVMCEGQCDVDKVRSDLRLMRRFHLMSS